MHALAYLDSGSGSPLVGLIAFAGLVITVAVAFAAKRATEARGQNGWLFFFLVLLVFPIGILATLAVVLFKREVGTT